MDTEIIITDTDAGIKTTTTVETVETRSQLAAQRELYVETMASCQSQIDAIDEKLAAIDAGVKENTATDMRVQIKEIK